MEVFDPAYTRDMYIQEDSRFSERWYEEFCLLRHNVV
jgi:hypothetical protein